MGQAVTVVSELPLATDIVNIGTALPLQPVPTYIFLGKRSLLFLLLCRTLLNSWVILINAVMINIILLGLAAYSSLTHAVPISPDPADVASLLTRGAAVDACPGYTASNVVENENTLTADLTLSGDACNAYSDDIKDLKLLVEYQTSKYQHLYFDLAL